MARIPALSKEDWDEEQARIGDVIYGTREPGFAGPYAVFIRNPELAERIDQLGIYLRDGTSLEQNLSEVAILAAARHWNAQFEWVIHEIIARRVGIDEGVMENIRQGRRPKFEDEEEEAVYDYTTELFLKREVQDTVHERTVSLLGENGVVELVCIVGFYSMIAIACNAFQPVLPEDFDNPLPVRG